jgi:hypothetical protein
LSESDPLDVVVVGPDPAVLSALFARAPGVRVTSAPEPDYKPGSEDVVIFDRVTPPSAPAKPALLIAPRAVDWIGPATADERQPRWARSTSHPVMDGVDPQTLDIKRATGLDPAGWQVLARSEHGTPLVAVSDTRDRRLAIVTFAFADSNLAAASAFPVLVGNAIEWLARPALESNHRPGPLRLPGSIRRVVAPDGSSVPLVRAGGESVAMLRAPGLYLAEGAGSRSVIAVNAGDAVVSSLSRTTLPPQQAEAATVVAGGRPWWLDAVVVAFILAAAEWWTWIRRVTV